MLSPHTSRIWVGLNSGSDAASRQGVVNVNDKDFGTTSIPMIIRPVNAIANGLSFHHYRNVVSQLKKMGVDPVTIEIDSPKTRYVYDGKRYGVLVREEKVKPLPSPNSPKHEF